VHAGRSRRGRARTRILYWFRTPPGVRVGRSALDEDAIRLIEEHNPELTFDWTRILKGGPDPEPPPQERRQRPRPESERRPAPVVAPPPETAEGAPEPSSGAEIQAIDLPADSAAVESAAVVEPQDDAVVTPALARFGSEGLARLRARHAELLTRIAEQVQDPEQREQLKTTAERLNPDVWVTEAEVTAGIDQYEVVFESLRSVLGRRRRRRRRRDGQPREAELAGPAEDQPDGADAAKADTPDDSEPEA